MFSWGKEENFYALLEGDTDNLLVFSQDYSCILHISEFFLDTRIVLVTTKKYFTKIFYMSLAHSDDKYLFKWDRERKKFVKNNDVTKDLIEKSGLAISKYEVLCKIKTSIEEYRNFEKKDLKFQDDVYMQKKQEAERYKDKGYPEIEIFDFPFIRQYATFKKISFKESADAILLKAKLNEGPLVFSEMIRLKYFDLIKRSQNIIELKKVYDDFILNHEHKK